MHEVLTHAEKSLTENGQLDAVNTIRHLFQETMEAEFRELSSGSRAARWWRSSAATTSTPTSAELFILDGPAGRPDDGA